MIRILILICLFGAPVVTSADDRQLFALGEAIGALSTGVLFDAYLAFTHAESIISANPNHPITQKQVARHLAAMRVLELQNDKLRKAFADDAGFLQFLDRLKTTTAAVKAQGEALLAFLRNGQLDDLKASRREKETARTLLVPLLGFPDGGKDVP